MMRRMKVLVADKFEKIGLEDLAAAGHEVKYAPETSEDALAAALGEHAPEVLVVRSTRVSAAALAAAPALELVVRAGAGYDTIDVAAASRAGIFVANCPRKNSIAVAELTWALILACDRRLPDQCADLRAGRWNKKLYGDARGLYGRTLGILGFGSIGREVAERGRAFGMHLAAWSRSLDDDAAHEAEVERFDSPLALAAAADVISIHVASRAETENLVDRAFVEAMRPGAYLINTSRGAVVDEDALLWGIREKGLRAGLDVYRGEPGSSQGAFESPLAREPGVIGSHHIGASTAQAQQAIAGEAVRIICEYGASGRVPNAVNLAEHTPAVSQLTVRHQNRPGVLASVFSLLNADGINVQEMENIIYEGGEAACARIRLSRALDSKALDSMRHANPHILGLEQKAIVPEGAPS